MMTYGEFKDCLEKEVVEEMKSDVTFRYFTKRRVNNVNYEAMMVLKDGEKILPMFPVQPCFEAYKYGTLSLELIKDLLIDRLKNQLREAKAVLERLLQSSDTVKKIYMRVVNYKDNEDWLKNYPHKRELDFAITYYVHIEESIAEFNAVDISYKFMEKLNLKEEELYELAYANSIRDRGPFIQKLSEYIGEEEGETEEEVTSREVMYLLSNNLNRLGAVCMFYEGVLQKFAEHVQGDFYIIPSSIHEVILLPCEYASAEYLGKLVKEVNNELLLPQEVLGDGVYVYRYEKQEIEVMVK